MEIPMAPLREQFISDENGAFELWLRSPEGKQVISDTLRGIQQIIAEMKETEEIPFHLLHTPIDL